jgi:haloalkane dehalogenase
MGLSENLPGSGVASYRFVEHRHFLDALLEQLGVFVRVVLVGHDWGGVLAIDWARRHPAAVRGIAYLETLTGPLSWDGPDAPAADLFGALRSSSGEQLVLVDNVFVEQVLPAGIMRRLDDEEMENYRAPYRQPGESRRPTLTWPRQIPIDGDPSDVHDIVLANRAWMASTPVPKLFINGDPGALLTGALRQTARTWPHQREITVPGLHFLPEDSPEAIGAALAGWIPTLR